MENREYIGLAAVIAAVETLCAAGKNAVVGIDGRCGSGKTTLAQQLQERFDCPIIHMDDFYLPVDERAENWLEVPAGNMDLERVRREVLNPLCRGEAVCYRPFDCHSGTRKAAVMLPQCPLTVVEGSYAHHPVLRDGYDLTIFVTCGQREQSRRLMLREGERFVHFQRRWIPKEEQYFSAFRVQERSDFVVETDGGEGV